MKSTEKSNIKWSRVIRPMAMSLVLVFLLSYATFAWMKRDWTPTLTQENVKIIAGSSLTFVYVDENSLNNDKTIETTPVNNLLGLENFAFKSVSNSTGKSDNFFGLTAGSSPLLDTYNYLDRNSDVSSEYSEAYDNPYTAMGLTNGYIEMRFRVSLDEGMGAKGIYLHKDSYIKGVEDGVNNAVNDQAARAMRVSVTVHAKKDLNEANEETFYDPAPGDLNYIFAKSPYYDSNEPLKEYKHTGITAVYNEGEGYFADKQHKTDEEKYLAEENDNVRYLDLLNEDSYLFDLNPDELEGGIVKDITVRIWLEGTDKRCTDRIADSALDIVLKFTAGPARVQS